MDISITDEICAVLAEMRVAVPRVIVGMMLACSILPVTNAAEADDTVVKQAPASRSAQSVYQEQHALFTGRFTLETGISYAHSDRRQLALSGFLALDAIFLGNISVDEVKADTVTANVLARWGITRRLQVDLNVPYLYRQTVYQSTGGGSSTSVLSEKTVTLNRDVELGDVSAGMYYEVSPETTDSPDVVWNFRVKAPTGTNPYGIKTMVVPGSSGNLKVPETLPSGNGVWSASTGLSFVKTVDPAILFANVGYFYNFPEKFNDISSESGTVTPGSIKLGDAFQYGAGTAFAVNETTSISLSFSQRITAKSRIQPVGSGWQDITGSEGNAAILDIGVTHAMSQKASMVFDLGVGLTQDAPDLTVSVKFPYTF